MKKVLSGFVLCLLLVFNLQAQQIKSFTQEDEIFLGELSQLFQGLERQERVQAQARLDTFALLWRSGTLMADQKQLVYNTLNSMLGMRLRPWPDYALYLNGVIKVLQSREADRNFTVWHQSFENMLNINSQRRLLSYWQKTLDLFENQIIFRSSTVRWQLRHGSFHLVWDGLSPAVAFSGVNLLCYAQNDSTMIFNTSGKAFLLEDRMEGQGGRLTWERVLLDPQKVYADLSRYAINLTMARFEADSVTFFNTYFFEQPLPGKLSERVLAEVKPEDSRFPRFESYQAVHEIKNLFPGIDFRGGFTMQGQRVVGSGTGTEDARLDFYRNDSLFVTAHSKAFSIREDRILSENAAVSVYMTGDSIFHTGLNLRYLSNTREITMQRDERGTSRAPFYNTFHKIDMYAEALYWKLDEFEMEFRMIKGLGESSKAVFESHDFFSDLRYMRIQGLSELHPLIRLRNYSQQINARNFTIMEYARFVRSDPNNLIAQMLTLANFGFVAYDSESQEIHLQDRLFHYIGAYVGRNDFDVIQLTSEAPVNARLNMNNFDLHIYGVERIPLSDVKNVVIHPYEQQVIMKQNRDIYFDGRIESGLFDFYGREFYFNYDQFKIQLVDTDSMSFRVRSFDADSRGQHNLVRVRTVLEGINGELLVDHPRNKSGRLPYPRYPIFNSTNESYVYYDREFVQGGAYRREDVYFKLVPFSIDSLDNATTDNIAFDGVFISTNIFPDFYDYLTVQKDYSLGFNTKTPPQGYPVYQGKAVYKGPIDMSYEGLRADGRLEYLNATVEAKTMLMYPDSARASVNMFDLAQMEGPVPYPEVRARDVNMLYLPHQDEMTVSSTTRAIDMYAGLGNHKGDLTLTPEGLGGKGVMELFGGELFSQKFVYREYDLDAERANLKVMSADKKDVAFESLNYQAHVDFAGKQSEMKAVDARSQVNFPLNRYIGHDFNYQWDMPAGRMHLENNFRTELAALGRMTRSDLIDLNFRGHELISVHPAQDSLRFFSGKADFDIHENILHAQQVKLVKVADAAIFPFQDELFVLPRAEIKKLEQASSIANVYSKLHSFYDASFTISSRRLYSGEGNYDYVDESGRTQQIYFEKIEVDRADYTTRATGRIEQESEFTLSPRFGYFGDVLLTAARPDLTYHGAASMMVDCGPLQSNWVRFRAELKKDSLYIPIASENLRNDANNAIVASLVLAGDSVHVYPAIFDRKRHYSDTEILTASGYITWDALMREYKISTAEKLANNSLPDNLIRINPNTCMLMGEGDVNLGSNFGQFKMTTFGGVSYDIGEQKLDLDLTIMLDHHFVSNALTIIENSILNKENLQPLNLNSQKYGQILQKRIGERGRQQVMEEYLQGGALRRVPTGMEHTMFFADVKLRWNQEALTFHSTDMLGLHSIQRNMVSRQVKGFMEVKKQRGGDVFNMILSPLPADEGPGIEWFFFTYTNGVMQTIAHSNDYNNIIRGLKPKQRQMQVERGQPPFTFVLSSDRRPFDFVRSMNMLK